MPRITKKELQKQELYNKTMALNGSIFAQLVAQRLGLEKNPITGFIMINREDDNIDSMGNEVFTFDGYKFVFNEDYERYEHDQSVKLFDPYNNIKLIIFLVNWYMVNIQHWDVDECVLLMAISNNVMNATGYGFIKFMNEDPVTHSYKIWELRGNNYHRDCIKYLDLIYKMDGAISLEYDKLKSIDIEQYDKFNG